jgi:hypothetical protein
MALVGDHQMSAFIREAVENELCRREKLASKSSQDGAAEQTAPLVGQQSTG